MRLALFVPILALALGSCASVPDSGTQDTLVRGEAAPEFNAVDQRDWTWSLISTFGKPVLIDFWATWCAPCLQALPHLDRLATEHRDRIQVLGLATDQQGWAVVRPVVNRYELGYAVGVVNPSLAEAYGVRSYPYLVLVHNGRIVKRLPGRYSYQDLEAELAEWLH